MRSSNLVSWRSMILQSTTISNLAHDAIGVIEMTDRQMILPCAARFQDIVRRLLNTGVLCRRYILGGWRCSKPRAESLSLDSSRCRSPLSAVQDRAGNLMIAGAQDGITCDLAANSNRTLNFHVDAHDMLPDTYRASVWATHSGDAVLRRDVSVAPGRTEIKLTSDVDHIGFAVYRTVDGQCVDLMEENLVLQVDIQMRVDSGRTLRHQVRQGLPIHKVNLPGDHSSIRVESDHDSSGLDKGIRRHMLDRQVYLRETALRRERNFARFGPDEFDKAALHFISLLSQDSDQAHPVFLADPFFMSRVPGPQGTQLYLDIFAATTDGELCILCAHADIIGQPPWWLKYHKEITDHISVRVFRKHNNTPGFHDRYLVTRKRETLITHSLSGWPVDGVTFVNLPFDMYRTEAVRLWSMDLESTTTALHVREICR